MRGTRWLLLVAIAAILGGVGLTYRAQKKALQQQAPPKPQPLPLELNSRSEHWHHQVTDHGRLIADIDAEDVSQVKDSARVDLRNVTLKMPDKDGQTYSLVRCAAASFSTDMRMYSEGDVEITLKVPFVGQPQRTLVSIKSSGVAFDTATGRVSTDRPSSFTFQNGDGTAAGASYDPTTGELLMKNNAELHWRPVGPNAKPMKIEGASLTYKEAESQVWLRPWGRLTREHTVVEGENVLVQLQDQTIQRIQATKAHGSDTYPERNLQYAADELWVDVTPDGLIQKITAQTNARLTSASPTSETTVNAYHVEMNFQSAGEDSTLTDVYTSGDSAVTSKPLPAPGRQPSETHVLRSQTLEMRMRPGGREIERVITHSPGTLEFVPNAAVQRHRLLESQQMLIAYGPESRIESFRATGVKTATDPTADERKRNRVQSRTASRDMVAKFDPRNSRMLSMEQSGDFSYEEGERKARAAKATLDAGQNVILLEDSARVWDSTGSTSADRIRMDQASGDFTADGRVNSTRLPDRDQKGGSQMLSGEEPLQARARRMESTNQNRRIRYEGGAVVSQAANRIEAETIDIDREKRTLLGIGNVVTSLWEGAGEDAKKKTAAPVLTVVRANRMLYTEENRLALYTGGAVLNRPTLNVKGRELRAFLAPEDAESRLEKAFADGAVMIVQNAKDRTRSGTGEKGEYYTADQRVVLGGDPARLVESPGSTTEGRELTYFANDDRLLVNGAPQQPGRSRIVRKRK